MNISEFLHRKLKVLNTEKSVKIPKEKDFISRVSEAVIRANNLRSRVSIEVGGIDVTAQYLDKAKIALPDALNKPRTFEAFASDGSSFGIEVE